MMIDPNGMFLDAEGTYHLYYQCKAFPLLRHASSMAILTPGTR